MKNFNEMSFPEKLTHTRSYFLIHGIYFVPVKSTEDVANAIKHSGGKSKKKVAKPTKERDAQTVVGPQTDKSAVAYNLFINDPWENRPLDVLLTPHRDAYENTLKDLVNSDESLEEIQTILESERRELDKHIREYETEQIRDILRRIAEQQFPGYLSNDLSEKGKRQPFYYDATFFNPEALALIESAMHTRQGWLRELQSAVDEVVYEVKRITLRDISKKPHVDNKTSLNLSELWYPLEQLFFAENFDNLEIKKLRAAFFNQFGITDKGYAKNIATIKERQNGKRSSFLKTLTDCLEDNFKHHASGGLRKFRTSEKKKKQQNI